MVKIGLTGFLINFIVYSIIGKHIVKFQYDILSCHEEILFI